MRTSIFLSLLIVAACGKDDARPAAGKTSVPAASSRDGLLATWKQGGLTPSAFTPAQVSFGTDCRSGTVGAIDVLVCSYPTAPEATSASDAAYRWVGDATGAVKPSGKLLIAAADRRKSDPSGRTINQLLKLATK
ncbi:MAG: hypothetical protein WKG01_12340 [Kofleriaceae bacterium]